MTTPKSLAALGALAFLLATTNAAKAADLRIFPIPGLYGLEHTACDQQGPAAGFETAKIARDFCGAFTLERRTALGRHFADRVTAAFPGVVTRFGENVGPGETREASLSKTVIASIHISRADLWVVDKPGSVDVFEPITVSLFLTNALSGEVMFVQNCSTEAHGTLSTDHYLDQARLELDKALDSSVDAVVKEAASRFKPYAVTGTVRARIDGRYVLDSGRKQGIREGDTIGADAKVVFCDPDYSVVEPLLGDLRVGQTLSRQVAQPIEVLAKPSALVVVANYPAGTSRGYINTVFEDAVGQGGELAIAPVNPSFGKLRELMLGQAGVSATYASTRTTPDFFVRLSVAVLDPLDLETNVAHARRKTYEAWAFVEVIDHAGRVVFATHGTNRIVDDVLYGVSFSPEQRRDSVIKNALVEAAAALGKGFHPARLRLDARPAGGEVDIADAGGALGQGSTALLLRRNGAVSGVPGEVWMPAGSVEVVSTTPVGAHARFSDVEARTARSGDQAAYESGAGAILSRRQFAPCEGPDGHALVQNQGSVEQPLFGPIAFNAFAASFPAPFRLAHFDEELRPYLSQFADAAQLGVLQPRPADICVLPVYRIEPAGEKASSAFVSPIYQVAMGYSLKRDGVKVGGGALQQTLTATGVPAGAEAAVRDATLQYDLASEASALAPKIVRALKPPE
jgi:hypothetical protein